MKRIPKVRLWKVTLKTGYLLTQQSYKIAVTHAAEKDYLVAIQYLAPEKTAGKNVCPFATDCAAPCLATSGRMIMSSAQKAMRVRTKYFWDHREDYKKRLVREVWEHVRRAKKQNKKPAIRLNGTSDLAWEIIFPSLFTIFPYVQFYDYTKFPYHKRTNLPKNYYLLRSHHAGNNANTEEILKRGNLAVCFTTKRLDPLPTTWRGYKVIDGDLCDLRFKDKKGVVVGLRAKGKARKLPATENRFIQAG